MLSALEDKEALSVFRAQRLAWGVEAPTPADLTEHLPLVHIALDRLGRYLPPDVDMETLEGQGVLALIEAAKHLPPNALGFESFARVAIWRAVTECLRESRYFMKDTRVALDKLAEAADRAMRIGLEGRAEELAQILAEPLAQIRADLEQVAALMAAAPQSVVTPSMGNQVEHRIARAICDLPQVEQLVVAMYYLEDLTFTEIAEVIGVGEQEVQWAFGRAAVLLRVHLSQHTESLV